jgi:uncharacterized integral membrane protein
MSLMMRNLINGNLATLQTIRLGIKSSLPLFLVFVNVNVDSIVLNLLIWNWRLNKSIYLILIAFINRFTH